MKNIISVVFAVIVLLLSSLGVSNAVPLVISRPSVPTPLPGTTAAMAPNLAGTVVVDEIVPFSFVAYDGDEVFGTVQVRVVWADDYTYDFYWRIINDVSSAGAIEEFRIGNFFNTSIYDGDYRIDGLGDLEPEYARAFADASGNPDGFINFFFAPEGLKPGQESKFFFLDTDATNFARTLTYDLTNIGATSNSPAFSGYAPAPGSVASDAVIGDGVKVKKFVTVASGADIGANVILNKNSTIGVNTIIGDNSLLNKNIVIGNDAVIGKNVKINKNVIIGNGVTIGDNSVISKGTVIRDDATVGTNVTLGKNVTVLEATHIPDGERIPKGTVIMQ